MINVFEVRETNKMIEESNLDVRTITMGISLLDWDVYKRQRIDRHSAVKKSLKLEKYIFLKKFKKRLAFCLKVVYDSLSLIHILSMSLRLFLSVMSWISSSVITKARIAPAMGTITVSDRFCIMLKMLPFHACGDKPTWPVSYTHLRPGGVSNCPKRKSWPAPNENRSKPPSQERTERIRKKNRRRTA